MTDFKSEFSRRADSVRRSDFVKKVTESARDFAESIADKAEDAFEVLSERAEDAYDTVRERGSELRERAQESMRETPVLNRAKAMYELIGEGRVTEAFERYYHDDVVIQENDAEPRRGKQASRDFLQRWMADVETSHGGGVKAITSNEADHVTIVETWGDVTFKDGRRVKIEEVAVQHWEDGLIVRERFYYKEP